MFQALKRLTRKRWMGWVEGRTVSRIQQVARPRGGRVSDEQFVAQVYEEMFRRSADDEGLAYWCARLRQGLSRAEVVRAFRVSPEYRYRQELARRTRIWNDRPTSSQEVNWALPDVWQQPIYQRVLCSRLAPTGPVVLLGSAEQRQALAAVLTQAGRAVVGLDGTADAAVDLRAFPGAPIVVCAVPASAAQWQAVQRLKQEYGARVTTLLELAQPFTVLTKAAEALPYAAPLEKVLGYYLGEEYLGPIDELDRVFPLSGKRVIEFGPLDGGQTAGLVKAGARSVTCVEARPENGIKTLLARYAFGWDHVRVVMDDLHNADALKYGRFDLAFAHGVYYHSVAPFLFLENLLSLADNVFLGGYCATDERPSYGWDVLEHQGAPYRVKVYREMVDAFVAGVNDTAYYFHADDLIAFFRRAGCAVEVLSDEVPTAEQPAGRYLRLLARRRG
jgi:hypothetical protein